jgi:hypothetical protein
MKIAEIFSFGCGSNGYGGSGGHSGYGGSEHHYRHGGYSGSYEGYRHGEHYDRRNGGGLLGILGGN